MQTELARRGHRPTNVAMAATTRLREALSDVDGRHVRTGAGPPGPPPRPVRRAAPVMAWEVGSRRCREWRRRNSSEPIPTALRIRAQRSTSGGRSGDLTAYRYEGQPMTTPRPNRRRTRTPAAQQPPADDVARVLDRRDKLDAARADDRDHENKLLAEYLATVAEEAHIGARRDAAFADLDEKRTAAIADAEQAFAANEKRRAAVIGELNKRRSVQSLVIMLELPRRRIDKLIRLHNEPNKPEKASLQLVKTAPESDEADAETASTTDGPPRASEQPPRPPELSAEPASVTETEPDATPAADHVPADSPADPIPDPDQPPPTDNTDRLF